MAKKPVKTGSLQNKNMGLKNKNIVVANTLVRSAQSLSLAEKRLLFASVAKMGNNFGDIVLTASEYAETFDMPVKQAYDQMKSACDNFFNRYFTLNIPDRIGVMRWKIRWLSSMGYEEGMGRVGLRFTEEVLPYLCDLTREFTKYKLKQACALRSIHSWRLLELFEQQSSGWLNITVENFCYAMEATDTHKKNFNQLLTKIIEPAIKELIEKDGWLIGFEISKNGRKVHMLKFTFERDPQGRLPL